MADWKFCKRIENKWISNLCATTS